MGRQTNVDRIRSEMTKGIAKDQRGEPDPDRKFVPASRPLGGDTAPPKVPRDIPPHSRCRRPRPGLYLQRQTDSHPTALSPRPEWKKGERSDVNEPNGFEF